MNQNEASQSLTEKELQKKLNFPKEIFIDIEQILLEVIRIFIIYLGFLLLSCE